MASRTAFVSALLFLALLVTVPTDEALGSALRIEDRVRAQELIERVYYAHQLGATRPFEEVFTRALLERKVRTYLEQSVALEQRWGHPVTAADLADEWERIVRNTRYPGRLREIGDTLGWDPVLLYECLARPTLVNRRLSVESISTSVS